MDPLPVNAIANRIGGRYDAIGKAAAPDSAGPSAGSFGSVLEGLLRETSQLQNVAEGQVEGLMTGKKADVQEVMLAVAKADLSFKFMLEVRNKLLEAYQEVMRMQV